MASPGDPSAGRARIILLAPGTGDARAVARAMLSASPDEFAAADEAFRVSATPLPADLFAAPLQDASQPPARRLRALASLVPTAIPADLGAAPVSWLTLAGSEAPPWAPRFAPLAGGIDPGPRELIARTDHPARAREARATLVPPHSGRSEGLTDLYLLSRCREVLGSMSSGFLSLAEAFGAAIRIVRPD